MKKCNDLPSFPANLDVKANSSDQEDDNELKAALNVSFLENLDDLTKFSYAGMCAATLHLLYDSDNSTYCHEFVASFVGHLCLPSNVANTMQAIADGHAEKTTDVFLDTLKQNQQIQEDPLLMVNDLVMWAITATNGSYDARTRYIIRHISWKLQIKYEDVEGVEELLIQMLRSNSEKEKGEQEATRLKKAKRRKWKRYALIGLATAGGGALVGLTGGLAAPLVAAGAGAILGGASAAALGSVAGIAVITSLFGAAGAGLTGYKMKRRVGGIDEFMFKPLTVSAQPNITIVVSGWLSDDNNNEFVYPWRRLMHSKEQYTLVWESKHLKRLGNAFEYILNSLMSVAATEALKYTVLAGLMTAITWPATLISAAGVIDNPWSVCIQRAVQVGRQLAEVLLAREHGCRPVTLIGYSLGARVIFHCLEEMSKRKNHQGIIEDVYLLGAPVSGDPKDWAKFKTVVAGHITNAYSRTDWLLKFLYRTSSIQVNVAGLQPVMWEDRRMMNIDLSSVIDGHLDYAKRMDIVLSAVGIRTTEELMLKKNAKQNADIADNELTTDDSCAKTSHDESSVEPSTSRDVQVNDGTMDSQSHSQIGEDSTCTEPAAPQNADVDDKPYVKSEIDHEKNGEEKCSGDKETVEMLSGGVTLVSTDCDGFEIVDKIA